jgi:hypothetical protein
MAVVCGEPPEEIHALFATAADEGPVSYPQITEVTCREGYTVGGDPRGNQSFGVRCLANGKFSKYDANDCEPVRCGAPPAFDNAEFFEIIGGGEIFGSGELELLKRKAIRTKNSNINFEEAAIYECLPGYTAGGEFDASVEFLVECLANGELSYPPPDQQCRNVDACAHHTCGPKGTCVDVIGDSIDAYNCNCSYGFAVKMVDGEKFCGNIDDCGSHKCGAGVCKDLIGDYTCICPAGHFVGFMDNEKTCVPVECAPETPVLEHGKMLSHHTGAVSFPASLRYECGEGYSTDGSVGDAKKKFHANCKADGSLYGLMSCQPVSCGTPRILPFTTISAPPGPHDSVDYGEKVTYKCFDGYYVGGTVEGKTTFTTECKASGVLSDPEVCDPVGCGPAPLLPHAYPHIEPAVFYGMHLHYFCETGYTLDGSKDGAMKFPRRCLANGKFETLSTEEPCKPVSAGELPEVANAKITEYNGIDAGTLAHPITGYYPSGVEYHCLPGFTLTGGTDGPTKFVTFVSAFGNLEPSLPEMCLPVTFYARGRLKDARTGSGLSGAVVRVMGTDLSASSSGGYFTITDVAPGTYTVKFSMDSYISVEREITISGNINVGGEFDVSMSPAMQNDQWRAVLKWNAQPTDLDTYAMWGYSKVCWYGRHKYGSNMEGTLEKDDVDGFGPETLYLNNIGNCRGGSYSCDIKYEINDYTQSGTMLQKGAEVTLYSGSRVVGEWKIEDCAGSVEPNGNWWHVFTIDGRTNQLKWNCQELSLAALAITPGLSEEVYYFQQGENMPDLNSRIPDMQRVVNHINYNMWGQAMWPGLTKKDDYAVRWEGSIRINNGGEYTFFLASDDGSQMWLDEDMVINNGGVHAKRQRTGTRSLLADVHALKIDYFNRDGGNGCVFKYKGRDTSEKAVVVPQSALLANPVLAGLTEEVFFFDQSNSLTNLTGRTPNMARGVDHVNYETAAWPGFERAKNFAVRWTGFVEIDVPGEYTFTIGSDDSSKLWVKDEQLIDNDGTHSFMTKSANKNLTTGYHRIRMEYSDKNEVARAKLEYKGPDSNNTLVVIPKTKLKKAAGTPPVFNLHAGLKELVYYYAGNPEENGDRRYSMPFFNGMIPSKSSVVSFINYPESLKKWFGFTQAAHYAVRYTGSMLVKTSGSYELQVEADDGSMLWWSNERLPAINNSGLHALQAKSARRNMTKGIAYALRIDYFQNDAAAGCKFSYAGPDTDGVLKVVPRRALLQSSPLTGLFAEWFYFTHDEVSDKLPDTSHRQPDVQKRIAKIDWLEGRSIWDGLVQADNFAARFSGSIVVRHAGTYKFWLGSDDGSKLYLGDLVEIIIDNDGAHGYREVDGSKEMIEGETPIRIDYFQGNGQSSCRFFWQGRDTDDQKTIVGTTGAGFRRLAGPP